ncbi:MAG: hypothetical protein OXH79_18775 [Boseongicola sp.]|nr:hypothetical protein [Boseongicola sp.]
MNDLSGCPKGIAGSGVPSEAGEDCDPRPTPENERRFDGIRTDELSVALDPESIAGDDALPPRWNARRAEMQSMWWLPHRTAAPGHDVRPSDMPSSCRGEASCFWTRTILPAGPASAASLRIWLPSATPVTASGLVKGTRRIRTCPKIPELLHEMVRRQRRAYNLAIACFREADAGLAEPKGPDLKRTALHALSIWLSSKKPIGQIDQLCPNWNSNGRFRERRLGNEGSHVDI